MIRWVRSRPLFSAVALLLLIAFVATVVAGSKRPPARLTTTLERGSVTEVVSVSGTVAATQSANLTFPTNGTVADILVARGDVVASGDVLAILGDRAITAERARAVAALAEARATLAQTQAGQTSEARAVTETTVANAREELTRAQTRAKERIATTRASLLSVDLTALAMKEGTRATAPEVTGNYTCDKEGSYRLRVYQSGANSGYSYQFDGLEGGTASASTHQSAPLGSCGLFVRFTKGDSYSGTEWVINVPNPKSETYIARKNAYQNALTEGERNIAAARDALRLAEGQATVASAGARAEARQAAQARVEQAAARVRTIDSQLADFTLTAPFAGIVTNVHIELGETVREETAITLLNTDTFELRARVPEIDVTRLAVGQKASARFDAKADELVAGTITYVSPEAEEIDGVGYFTAVIELTPTPDWIRDGLNADIDIAITTRENVPRLPQRFVEFVDGEAFVLVTNDAETVRQTVELGLQGNDGYVEIINLPADTIVAAP